MEINPQYSVVTKTDNHCLELLDEDCMVWRSKLCFKSDLN